MNENSSGQCFDSLDGLFDAVERFLGEPSADVLQRVFQEWI
jgi:hypothetical protein